MRVATYPGSDPCQPQRRLSAREKRRLSDMRMDAPVCALYLAQMATNCAFVSMCTPLCDIIVCDPIYSRGCALGPPELGDHLLRGDWRLEDITLIIIRCSRRPSVAWVSVWEQREAGPVGEVQQMQRRSELPGLTLE
ncbi:hypothetical protein EMCRGX_G005921 [Ephydatia muelleri]